MRIQVYRGAGDQVGSPVIQPLLSDSMLVVLGKHLMDVNAHQKSQVKADIVYREGLQLGQLVSVPDPTSSSAYTAKITGISFQLSNGAASQSLNLERPLQ